MNKLKIICHGCSGKKFVNHCKLNFGDTFTVDTKTIVKKCLICKGTGKIVNGKDTKDKR